MIVIGNPVQNGFSKRNLITEVSTGSRGWTSFRTHIQQRDETVPLRTGRLNLQLLSFMDCQVSCTLSRGGQKTVASLSLTLSHFTARREEAFSQTSSEVWLPLSLALS